jgi:hypothetical protein
MKKILVVLLVAISIKSFGQDSLKVDAVRNKKIIAFIPSKVDEINGLAIGVWAQNLKTEKDSLKIKGINLEVNPLCFFGYISGNVSIDDIADDAAFYQKRKNGLTDIDGLNVSIPGFFNTSSRINGFSLTPFTICAGEINGVSISGITNCSYNLNGVSICGIYNSSNAVRGVQIGLFNKAKKLHGIQIGLWNKNNKRSLPFINWQFKN